MGDICVSLRIYSEDADGRRSFTITSTIVSDTVAPTVTSSSLASGATGVSLDLSAIDLVFSEPLLAETVDPSSVSLTDLATSLPVPGTVRLSTDLKTISFLPEADLDAERNYALSVAASLSDLAGNTLADGYMVSFSTEIADNLAPYVASSRPENGTLSRFNESVSIVLKDDLSGVDVKATVAESLVLDLANGNFVDGNWQWYAAQSRLVFTPLQVLADSTYQVTLHPTDQVGNRKTVDIFFTIQEGLADQDNIVSKYTMETIEGNMLVDERGRFNGSISGAAKTTGSGGIAGEALEFNGSQFVVIPKEVISGDQFGIAFFAKSSADAVPANGYLLGDSENPLNLFFRRFPVDGVDNKTYTGVVGDLNWGIGPIENKSYPNDMYNFIVINKNRDGKVEVFINGIETPDASGYGSTFDGLLSDLWLGNRVDMQRGFVGRIDELTIAARPFDLAARQELLGNMIITDGLVALYHMNGDWTDASGNGHHGTGQGGVVFDGNGIDGTQAGQFDGNGYVIVNPFHNFPTDEISASFWLKSNDTSNNGTPLSYATSQHNNEFLIYDHKAISPHVSDQRLDTYIPTNDGGWHHIVLTWKGSDGQTILYKDGSAVYSGTIAVGETLQSGGSLTIGHEQDSVGGTFEPYQAYIGSIDEVAIYNRIITPDEVQLLFGKQRPLAVF